MLAGPLLHSELTSFHNRRNMVTYYLSTPCTKSNHISESVSETYFDELEARTNIYIPFDPSFKLDFSYL